MASVIWQTILAQIQQIKEQTVSNGSELCFGFFSPDVNECEMLSGVCGEALCENVDGTFLCLCSDENQEYDPMTGQCRFRTSPGKMLVDLCMLGMISTAYVTNGKVKLV